MVGRPFCLLSCGFILAVHIQFGSSADFEGCKEFKIIPEGNYDRNSSSANDASKRPLGFMKGYVSYPVTTANVKKPCVTLSNLTSKFVEVLIQPNSGSKVCFKDDGSPLKQECSTGGTITSCYAAHSDTVKFEFYCNPAEGCESDAEFWYRLRISEDGMDPDEWCRERQVEFPQNLIQPPANTGGRTTAQPTGGSRIVDASILMVFAAVILASGFLIQK